MLRGVNNTVRHLTAKGDGDLSEKCCTGPWETSQPRDRWHCLRIGANTGTQTGQ